MNRKPAHRHVALFLMCIIPMSAGTGAGDEAHSPKEARQAMIRAVAYFREHVATHGGYLWRYSDDLQEREGEGRASATQIWVQPPGTPSVGETMLRAWQRTGERTCLEGARDAAHALVRGQLVSGGWGYSIEFDSQKRPRFCYRVDFASDDHSDCRRRNNTATFDDDVTQAALRLLMRYDRETEFSDRAVHDAVLYGLEGVLKAQYQNGGWPQRFDGPADPEVYPAREASYPESWSRQWTKPDYARYCTINDSAIQDVIGTLLLACEVYGEKRYLDAAVRGGDFLIRAHMPHPQPAWAQQYDLDMHPAWARKFEPPSIVTVESVRVLDVLMQLYAVTGQQRFVEPVPRALDWFEKVRLPAESQAGTGQWARFYELRTDRPLYFTTQYELVYSDDDLPTHYGFKVKIPLERLRTLYEGLDTYRAEYQAALHDPKRLGFDRLTHLSPRYRPSRPDCARVAEVIDALDSQGRWIERGHIQCRDFITNLDVLSRSLERTAEPAAFVPQAPADDPRDVRVMTFNIRYGTANDGPNHWDNRKDLVVEVLRKHAPDVVGLQEALRFQIDYLREKLPHYREVGVAREDGMEQGEYVPILYDARRFYAGASGTFWLSETPDIPGSKHWGNDIPRICTWARLIDKQSGTTFYLYNVHLDHIAQESREKGVQVIVRRIARRSHPDPVILTGDMNAKEDNPAIRYLLGQGKDPKDDAQRDTTRPVFLDTHRLIHEKTENESTSSNWNGKLKGEKIDYVFVIKSEPAIRVREAEIVRDHRDGRYPSDHYPVRAVLRLPSKQD